MNISYNWLRDYLPFDLTPDEVAAALTSIGLETGSVETVQSVRGGLAGLVTGRVLTCTAHPNSDHLHLTTVDVGGDEPLKIVCGAPNVAAGQMVVVAVIGTKLYDGDKEFVIKKSKIRGEESFGMICAEDEIGVGASHDGIIVLPADTPVGLPAAQPLVSAVTVLLTSVLSALVLPFTAAVTALTYIDLRMRKEGLDVELRQAAGV